VQLWARPLRVHLSVIIVLLLVAISVPLMWLTYEEGRRSALASAGQQMRLLSRNALDLYESVFRDGYGLIMQGAVLPSLTAAPPAYVDAKREFLVRALKASPHLNSAYVGYPDGTFFQVMHAADNPHWRAAVLPPDHVEFGMRVVTRAADGQAMSIWHFLDADGRLIGSGPSREADFDPRRRPWFKAALQAAGPVATGPYVSASTKELTLTLAGRMLAASDAVIGADVTLETIGRMLAEQAVSEHSIGYVFDDDGRLIVHSDPLVMASIADGLAARSAPSTLAVNDDPALLAQIVGKVVARNGRNAGPAVPVADDAVLEAVEKLIDAPAQELDGELVHFQARGEPWLARIASVGVGKEHLLEGYSIVIAAPVDDFTSDIVGQLKRKMMVAAAFVIAGILLALLVSRRISRTLVALAEDAKQIGNLDFKSLHKARSHISEINMLGRALSSARAAIHNFALYVPRDLVRQIVASGQDAPGGAVRREVTVLFTDIRDFTTISEQHTPEEIVDMLTAYFETMNVIVERNRGVIVQYLGDSIYAMWNAPTENPGHVADGCRCALELKAAIDRLNAGNLAAGRPELVTRFGLHTGVAVVGSVGAHDRRQYTAMGDTVNVASRLEGMNKQFGTTILASGAIKDGVAGGFRFRALGAASAKGRHAQVEIFELVGSRDAGSLPAGPDDIHAGDMSGGAAAAPDLENRI
jgi:adenylate cyclase